MAGQWQGGNLHGYNMNSSDGRSSPAPSSASAASVAATPARPARSVRRPARDVAPPGSSNGVSNVGQTSESGSRSRMDAPMHQQQQLQQHQQPQQPTPRSRPAPVPHESSASGSRAARLAQAIQKEEHDRGGRPGSSLSFRSASPDPDEVDFFGGEPLIPPTASTSKARQEDQDRSPVLAKAVAAFSSAGQTKRVGGAHATRARAGTTSSNRSGQAAADGAPPPGLPTSRIRRGAVGVQGESARRIATSQSQQNLPSTPAFREMERVLALVADEWPELLPPSLDEEAPEAEEEDNFDPVTLALSLVNEEGSTSRFDSFLSTKEALSHSLKSSIQTHYQAFDASASSYNHLVQNLTHAQKNTTDLRKVLEDVRETLGKRRTDLAVLEARRTELSEMDRILVTIETLKSIPDRLESLLSDKQFLQAASLLMRSLKMINRSEMLEVTATADLRSYFASQESLMLEYLTEELHSHLYLKSLYTESRWKAHTPDQTDLPVSYVERVSTSIFDLTSNNTLRDSDTFGKGRPTRLGAFLTRLSQKPSFRRNIDETIDETNILQEAISHGANEQNGDSAGQGTNITRSGSLASINSVTGNGTTNQTVTASKSTKPNGFMDDAEGKKANPEEDSFTYIESILESLAYLGKLGVALDSVLQRNPLEIYNLVENTAAEVDERNDPIRRSSLRTAGFGNSAKFLLNGVAGTHNSMAYTLLARSSMSTGSFSAEDASATSGLVDMNTEILLDFFWTLFSKLDAVLQGFRVFHEVVQRIVKNSDFKDSALVSKSGGLLFTLSDIWRPIQFEVQALLHDYLIDEQNNGSSRSATASINDVLRSGRAVRDPRKALFKFGESDSKATSRRIRPFEDSLNKALKSSVPGLVSSLAEGHSAGIGLSSHSNAFNPNLDALSSPNTASGHPIIGRTHRMLVPPNGFKIESLALPALKFLERAKDSVPEVDAAATAVLDAHASELARRCSGLMDEQTLEKLRPALNEYLATTIDSSSGAGGGSSSIPQSNSLRGVNGVASSSTTATSPLPQVYPGGDVVVVP